MWTMTDREGEGETERGRRVLLQWRPIYMNGRGENATFSVFLPKSDLGKGQSLKRQGGGFSLVKIYTFTICFEGYCYDIRSGTFAVQANAVGGVGAGLVLASDLRGFKIR